MSSDTYTRPGANERVRSVDFAAIEAAAPDKRVSLNVVDDRSGTEQTSVHYVRTPPGSSSPEGLHEHRWEQTFYIIAGTMTVEFEGEEPFELIPGDVVVFPTGVKHRNWNAGTEETIHLSISTPHKH